MTRVPTAILAAFLLGCGTVSAQDRPSAPAGESTQAPNAQPRTGLVVGVVDFVKVIDAYPRAIQERKKIEEFAKQRRAVLAAEERKAQEIKLKRDDFQPGTFDRDLKENELRQQVQYLDGLSRVFESEHRRRIEEFYVKIYEDMQRAVAKVAKDRGVGLVLRVHEDTFDGSTESKARVFEARVVWYASEEIDLTPAIIQLLQVPLPEEPKAAPAGTDKTKETTGSKPGN